ncbi:histidine kinase [Propionivibrio sp.]|uniref:histidine kinase n=1 Tax=Propionivibrio sp. TaxID=2212460 RepID=UPI002629218D|nr:histidine kinase [Propionivibrio sp.]
MFRSIGLKARLRQIPSVKALLLLSLAMILATVISATALLLDLRQKELAHAQGEIVSLTRILSEQTTRTFESVAMTMRGARERISDDIGRRFELDSRPIHLLLQARIAGLPQVTSLFLVDSQGLGVNSSRPDFTRRLSVVDREFFSHFVAGGNDEIFISRPEKARVDGQWTYYVSMRLLDADEQFRGVLVAAINIDYFESLYDSIGLDFVSRILLLNRDGVFLAGKPHDEMLFGKSIGNSATLVKLQEQQVAGVVVVSEESVAGRQFVAYRQVANYPLVVGAAVTEDDALTPWRQVMRPIVAGVVLVVLFVVLVTFLMARNLLRKGVLESALKDSDAQLRHMIQSARDAIVTVNSAKCVVFFNAAAEHMFGVRAEEAIGSDIDELLARYLSQAQLANLLRFLDEGWRSPDGRILLGIIESLRDEQEFPVELSLSTTTFRGKTLLTAVFRDLTERQRAERELLETNRQLQELSASLQSVREEERTGIARELHDELGQMLTGIRMEVSWLGGRLVDGQQALADKVTAIKGQIDQTIASVRRMSSELRPLVLDDLGFAAAAGWYVDQFSARTGLPVELVLPADDSQHDDTVATALFRVLQESLTNVARHARATRVKVRLDFQGVQWALSIHDDGVGFVHDHGRCGDLGLVGMRERAQILGGQFAVTTAPGAGTLIEVFIPAQQKRA